MTNYAENIVEIPYNEGDEIVGSTSAYIPTSIADNATNYAKMGTIFSGRLKHNYANVKLRYEMNAGAPTLTPADGTQWCTRCLTIGHFSQALPHGHSRITSCSCQNGRAQRLG